ncbi:MAG: Nif3-like dinuclear metal center hexameric protein [Lachnospiraceae bacterium]|nr:Nif3-like dinuclear metal center hexameric protein [Lachnospiraceae bacterium]
MNGRELIQILEEQSPVSCACDWDNVGLLVGSPDKEVKKIYIALDATDEAIEEAVMVQADMLLTHHPMIFKGMKRVTSEDFIGRRIIKLIQKDMMYYAMHTNFDVMGMADLAAARLGLEESTVLDVTCMVEDKPEGIGRVGNLLTPMSLQRCAKFTEAVFSLEQVKVFGAPDKVVKKVAVSPGSGKSEIKNAILAGADVLITGDIDHHDGIDAVAQGLCIIDAGHYGLEHIFVDYMKEYLKKHCEDVEIFTQKLTFPFWVV